MDALLAWYFVAVWGFGYVATKVGLQFYQRRCIR